jgi:CRP-like cAMP-binding protein
VTRQFATVTLHSLVDRGLISIRKRKIILHDQKQLRRLAAVF